MSGSINNLLLSEGTCYFGQGQQADSHYIPCGNANINGPQACCYEGDYCLSSNVCWDKNTTVTYIAGCTDSQFQASVCPQRLNYPDQQWVALARCDGDNVNLWTGCAHHPELIEIEKENCSCNMTNVLIENPNGKAGLDEIGLLPNKTGDVIQYAATAVPTATMAAGSHSGNSTGGGGGLSTGAKAGIGIGAGLGGALLIVGAALLFLMLRRRRPAQRLNDAERSELESYRAERAELGGNEKLELPGDRGRGASADTGDLSELSSDGKPAELEEDPPQTRVKGDRLA